MLCRLARGRLDLIIRLWLVRARLRLVRTRLRLVGAVVVVRGLLLGRVIRIRLRIVAVRISKDAWPKVWISPPVRVSKSRRPNPVHKHNMIVRIAISVVAVR